MERPGVLALVVSLCLNLGCSKAPPPASAAKSADGPVPQYASESIGPDGAARPGPLAPGRIVSIYGAHLGPVKSCQGTPDPVRREAAASLRPHQAKLETQIFPSRLCETEVFIGGVAAGLLYASAGQINFRTPQSVRTEGVTTVQVRYQGRFGPAVAVPLAPDVPHGSADQVAAAMWARFQRVAWQQEYHSQSSSCSLVPPQVSLRGGLYDHAYYCARTEDEVIGETFYFPVDHAAPKLRLLRADVRPAATYPTFNVEVEQALVRRLTQAFGPGSAPEQIYEIGAHRPEPGLHWTKGELSIFLHRNRTHAAPAGIRDGVVLIAVRNEVLENRRKSLALAQSNPDSPIARGAQTVEQTKAALISLLGTPADDPERAAARLVEADALALRLGGLLVVRAVEFGSEHLTLDPSAANIRSQLESYGVRYGEIGHYSGDLTYDRSLLKRAWTEYPGTDAGQRAFLKLQRLSCATPLFGCPGPECFRAVIAQGESFLKRYPDSRYRAEQTYLLALAHETWWSLANSRPDDTSAEGARVTKESAELARQAAIRLYEELILTAPGTREALAAELSLPRLKLKLDTGERAFFCFSC